MHNAPHTMVKFPVVNRMFGMDRLAKNLNALVLAGRITDWHPGRWTDGTHESTEIGFNSDSDAKIAVAAQKNWSVE